MITCLNIRASGQCVHYQAVCHEGILSQLATHQLELPPHQSPGAGLQIFVTTSGPDILILNLQMGKLRLSEPNYLTYTGKTEDLFVTM